MPTPEPTPEPDPEDLAPSGLSAKAVSGDDGVIEGVALAWDAPAEDAASVTGYEILRAQGDGEMATLVADTGSTGATHTDDTATEAGESYAYRVKALRDQEASQPSNQAVAIIPKATPVEPDPPIAERQTMTEVWSATLNPQMSGAILGCSDLSSTSDAYNCSNTDRLTSRSFTYDSTNYTITHLLVEPGDDLLFLNLGTTPTTDTVSNLTLQVGNSSFTLSSADLSGSSFSWFGHGLSWTAGTDVTVSLTEEAGAVAPTVSSVEVTSDPGADETYALGDTIQVTVTFDQAVTVDTSGGTPRIQLRVSGGDPEWADYSSGSGNEALLFAYMVRAGDEDTNGIYVREDELVLNGGTIQSADGTDANLAYARVSTLSGHKVDGVLPTPELAATSLDGASIIIIFIEPLAATTAPASAFTLAVDTGTAPAVTSATASGHSVTLGLASALTSDQVVAVTYVDPTQGDDAAAVQDAAGNDAASFTQTIENTVPQPVPADWGLIPSGLGAGDRFRLVFLSSTTRNAQSTNIADYNSFIQDRAAAGHADIRQYSSAFKVVGSTADVDARNNTATRYTGDVTAATDDDSDLGVAIYWLGGTKVADEYRDFYDEDWDDEAGSKDESGNDRSTSADEDEPFTGSDHDGTEGFALGESRALGASSVRIGQPNKPSLISVTGPINSGISIGKSNTRPFYGLSPVFRVESQTTTITVPVETTPVPTTWSLVPSGLGDGDSFRLLFIGTNGRDASDSDIAVYNTFLQNQVETNGHADIRAHSATFRMLGSTEDVDARDNTGTTGTGVPIYWLGGAKVADNYADFYDGDWDQETMGARETGVSVSIGTVLKIWTGSAQDGTEAMNAGGTQSRALGNSGGHWVMQGSPNGSDSAHGPIESNTANRINIRGFYGLSGVFTVDASLDADTTPPALESATVPAGGRSVKLFFDEALDDNIPVLPNSLFSVTADGSAVIVGEVVVREDQDLSFIRRLVEIGKLSPAITHGQVVTVSYNDPTTGDDATGVIQDAAGNDVASFTTGSGDVPAVVNNVPNAAPTFLLESTTREVAENSAAGTDVGLPVTATDDDGDTLTYTLEGTDAASFDIDASTGQILTKSGVTYDHEAKSSYSVTVKADDSNGGTDTIAVTINVTDEDEPPSAPAAPSVSAVVDSTTSLSVTWSAPDNTGKPDIESYDLQYRQGASGSWTDGPQDVTPPQEGSDPFAIITGLDADSLYQVQVRATNDEGDSLWSAPGTGTTNATAGLCLLPVRTALERLPDGGAIRRIRFARVPGPGPFYWHARPSHVRRRHDHLHRHSPFPQGGHWLRRRLSPDHPFTHSLGSWCQQPDAPSRRRHLVLLRRCHLFDRDGHFLPLMASFHRPGLDGGPKDCGGHHPGNDDQRRAGVHQRRQLLGGREPDGGGHGDRHRRRRRGHGDLCGNRRRRPDAVPDRPDQRRFDLRRRARPREPRR